MPHCPRCGFEYREGRWPACPRCLAGDPTEVLLLGSSIEVGEIIGRGGMGEVHRGRHRRLERDVAIKFLPEELAASKEFRLRFEREARALALLDHPHIVTIHDFGEEDEQLYLVMEYVPGGDVAGQIPLPTDRAVAIVGQVLEALEYAHGQGIVHRDIKPANILLDAGGRVKVSDFGLSRMVESEVGSGWTVTAPDQVTGTPHYMAPEALAGAAVDPRMDLFSVGVLLYQLVTGRLPVGHFEPLSGPLDGIVRRALAPDPERRFASAGEMRDELLRLEGGASLATVPSDPTSLPADEAVWRGAVAVLLSISTAVFFWAGLISFTPKVVSEGLDEPLVQIGREVLEDGRIVSRARFETIPILSSLVALVIGLLGYGLLRWHWRRGGVETSNPDEPVLLSRWVLGLGCAALGLYLVRRIIENLGHTWALPYIPVLGGMVLVAMLLAFWNAVLETTRRHRPLIREPRIWAGLLLGLVPPTTEFLRFLERWQP